MAEATLKQYVELELLSSETHKVNKEQEKKLMELQILVKYNLGVEYEHLGVKELETAKQYYLLAL